MEYKGLEGYEDCDGYGKDYDPLDQLCFDCQVKEECGKLSRKKHSLKRIENNI